MITKTLKDKRNNEYLVTLKWDKDAKYLTQDTHEPQFGMHELTIENSEGTAEITWFKTSLNVCEYLDELGFESVDVCSLIALYKEANKVEGLRRSDEA